MSKLLTHHQRTVNGFRMHYVTAGSGYPLVLLHGWPQSWYEWRKIIPALAENYQVIVPDLRGLGDSEKPMTGYDKRTMASDIRELVAQLGCEKIGVVGHDWGGAVAFYLAYDNRELVERLLILDMIPGLIRAGDSFPLELALKINHVFFHGGNPDWATMLVSQNIDLYLRRFLTTLDFNYSPSVFSEEDIAEYVRVNSIPGSIRAGFQWYAAGLREDTVNLANATEKLTIPVEAYGGDTFLGDIRAYWQTVAESVDGCIVPQCGHFIPEEKPDFVIDVAKKFFSPLQK
ncbi:MAG: pimeloyl-ACP methyl ester carboxylesterase [Gammaproteobacteria bacterium]|jgi:pimeloyl-ACP methyl ester carboxylesterase